MNIIYLDQPTAKTMTDARSALNVYKPRNKDGKFDEAIQKWDGIYKSLMKEILGRAA